MVPRDAPMLVFAITSTTAAVVGADVRVIVTVSDEIMAAVEAHEIFA